MYRGEICVILEMLNFRQKTWNLPSISSLPEVSGGLLIHYSPLNEPPRVHAYYRPHRAGLVAARVQHFESGDTPPPSPLPEATPSSPNSPADALKDTNQGVKVMPQICRFNISLKFKLRKKL